MKSQQRSYTAISWPQTVAQHVERTGTNVSDLLWGETGPAWREITEIQSEELGGLVSFFPPPPVIRDYFLMVVEGSSKGFMAFTFPPGLRQWDGKYAELDQSGGPDRDTRRQTDRPDGELVIKMPGTVVRNETRHFFSAFFGWKARGEELMRRGPSSSLLFLENFRDVFSMRWWTGPEKEIWQAREARSDMLVLMWDNWLRDLTRWDTIGEREKGLASELEYYSGK